MRTSPLLRVGVLVALLVLPFHLAVQGQATAAKDARAAAAAENTPAAWAGLKPVVVPAHGFAETPTLEELGTRVPALAPSDEGSFRSIPIHYFRRSPNAKGALARRDPVVQSSAVTLNTPGPALTFDGVNNNCSCTPPDTNGSVGPSNYVQSVNVHFQVFNKFTGAAQTAILPINSLFAGLGNLCETTNQGDPVVLYDSLADRWLIAQFAFGTSGANPVAPYFMSIAISKTSNPTGAYYAYCFAMPNNKLNDYPKLGVWPDGYYMTDNQFSGTPLSWAGAGVFAFDRAKMLAGDPTASYIYFDLNGVDSSIGGMLPSSLDGPPPPVGTPNYFTYMQGISLGDPRDAFRVFQFHADFVNTNLSTFVERPESPIAVAAFTAFSPSAAAITQSGTTQKLDSLADRLMHRLQYRNFGSNESLVVTHTATGGSGQAGIRYYQLRRNLPSGTFTINEQATFAPDTNHRWMGSAAMDYQGNLAVGYSASGSSLFPSIRYAARMANDPSNSLAQGEATLQAGAGSQTGSSRWGDYSALSVDPTDDCSYWYTTEYYTSSSSSSWKTRIGTFSLTGCTPAPRATIQGTVSSGLTGLPLSNAVVRTATGFFRATDGAGNYSMTVPPGTNDMSAVFTGLGTNTANGVIVINGGTTVRNFVIGAPTPIVAANGAALAAESCLAPNGAIDPGEMVTVNFSLHNIGSTNASNVVATLLATGGVTAPSGAQSYGTLIAGGATVARSYSLTATGTCSGFITATLQIQTNAASLGTVTFSFRLGQLGGYGNVFTQNFDSVTKPSLPAGWTTATSGGQSLWITTNAVVDTAPNAAFSPDPATVGLNELVSPVINISSALAKVQFRNNYNLEATTAPTGYDGGDLEIKIGGGAFQDILAAGGSFASNGYTRTISSSFSNPLAGRQAWSGNSGGYITTIANLPASAAGQAIQLKWRCGTDNSISSNGWFIDTISISDSNYVCCTGLANLPPVVTNAFIAATATNTTQNLNALAFASDPNSDPVSFAFQWQQSTNTTDFANLSGQTASVLNTTNTIAGDYYRFIVTPNDGQTNGAAFTTAFLLIPADSDGDGLNDDWEVQFFGNLSQNGTGDFDGDGFSNAQEFAAGTSPTDAASVPLITAITPSGADVVVSFTTVSGKQYELQHSASIEMPDWQVVETNINGTGGIVSRTDVGAASLSPRYYRVRVLP